MPAPVLLFPNSLMADIDVTGKVIATEALQTNLPMSAAMTETAVAAGKRGRGARCVPYSTGGAKHAAGPRPPPLLRGLR